MAFLNWIWNGLQTVGGYIVPLFGRAKWRGLAGFLRWTIHFILVALILVGLTYLNNYLGLERALRSPWPILHKVWLPLLFLFLYLLGWLGFWLWRLLGPDSGSAYFPDMDSAWDEGMKALYQASIDVTSVPIYLVLGRPACGEECLFHAARLPLAVQQTPHRPDAPLHIYATREAIYVTCAGSSLLGQQAELLAQRLQSQPSAPVPTTLDAAAPASPTASVRASVDPGAAGAGAATAQPAVASGEGQPAAAASAPGADESNVALAEAPPPRLPPAPPLLKNKEVMETLMSRLSYLCRLIARERRPYCSINGMFVLIPWAATGNDVQSSHIATLAQLDLQSVRESLQVECPLSVLVCDLETVPGFRDFIQALPQPRRLQSLGQHFALVPDVEPNEIAGMFERGIDAFLENELPATVYHMFRAPPAAGLGNGSLPSNRRLFQFLAQLRQQRKRLGRLLYRGTLVEAEAPPMVAGCYLVGTGVDSAQEQAFAAGVFQEMQENQNFVSWTPLALAEEWHYRRVTRLGYFSLVALVMAAAAACVYFFYWNKTI